VLSIRERGRTAWGGLDALRGAVRCPPRLSIGRPAEGRGCTRPPGWCNAGRVAPGTVRKADVIAKKILDFQRARTSTPVSFPQDIRAHGTLSERCRRWSVGRQKYDACTPTGTHTPGSTETKIHRPRIQRPACACVLRWRRRRGPRGPPGSPGRAPTANCCLLLRDAGSQVPGEC